MYIIITYIQLCIYRDFVTCPRFGHQDHPTIPSWIPPKALKNFQASNDVRHGEVQSLATEKKKNVFFRYILFIYPNHHIKNTIYMYNYVYYI